MSLSTLRPKKKVAQRRQNEAQAQSLTDSSHSCSCPHCHSPSSTHLYPPSHSSSVLRYTSSSSSPSSKSTRRSPRYWSCHPLRRAVKGYPHYSTRLSTYSPNELRRFHHQLQLRMMDMYPERWYDEAFPEPMRPLIKESIPELAKYVFTNRGAFYTIMNKHINDLKDGKTNVQLILVKPIPPNLIYNDVVWDFNVAPHCRFMYLEVQKTVIIHIAKETRFMESLPRDQLKYDDTDHGVQGHALGRIKYKIKTQLARMGIIEDEYDFLCNRSRKSDGVRTFPDDPAEFKSVHSCDRMFIPRRDDPKFDADGVVWPTMVIETGPAHANVASRKYLQFCVDWWFTQSDSVTKTVLLMYFDYANRETIVEKWVRAAEPPFHKTLAQTIVINIQPGHDKNFAKSKVVVSGQGLTLSVESLMGRPKREGETDIVFDKTFLTGFANGYLLPWPNVGPTRKEVLLGSGLKGGEAASLVSAASSAAVGAGARGAPGTIAAPRNLSSLKSAQAQLGPALSRLLATDVPRYLGTDGTPQVDVSASSIKVTLKRTNKPFENEDGSPVSGQSEIDKEENKKVSMEMSLEQMMALMGTQD
ncbi:hypothetical protein UA08_02005 [Talaromyces atroroseus]|uniref:Uncharacterized protein n=1 Tax=Talaromyces atroroseus TaxID=1441469 RepID=A0A1Q5QB34_TALAT|nr:hypothetical protein UA08_02005 [Talaromyces atroroseus]OKL63091.1 hypothetical protein UA08_02005 [Talaromyces atroroseus]